jgi:general secretion pathway protein J
VANKATRRIVGRGFTLLELLVAMAILGVVAVIAYGGLSSLVDSKQGVETHASRLASLQLAFQLMQRDLSQAVDRPVRDELGDRQDAMFLSATGMELAFTRVGEDLPLTTEPRSRLERVEYHLRDDQLWRIRWRQLDRVQGAPADEMLLMDGVMGWQWRFLDRSGNWQLNWPPVSGTTGMPSLPVALELAFEDATWGPLRRVLLVH